MQTQTTSPKIPATDIESENRGIDIVILIHKGEEVSLPEGLDILNPQLNNLLQAEFNDYKSRHVEQRSTRDYTILKYLAELYTDIALIENETKDIKTERTFLKSLNCYNSLKNPHAFSSYFYQKLAEKTGLLTNDEIQTELQHLHTLDKILGIT